MAKVGRPTKYKPEYCQQLIKYFENAEPYYDCPVETQDKSGNITTKMQRIPNPPPFLTKFARSIGVCRKTLYTWGKEHVEFLHALNRARDIFEEFLIENGLLGHYNSYFAYATAKNCLGWRDKQDVQHSGEITQRVIRLPAKKPVGAQTG